MLKTQLLKKFCKIRIFKKSKTRNELDDFLRKFDFSYEEYEVIKVETYIPESVEEVFSKKYDKKLDLLGDSNIHTSGEETHE